MVRKDKIKLVLDLHLPVMRGRCRVAVSAVNRNSCHCRRLRSMVSHKHLNIYTIYYYKFYR